MRNHEITVPGPLLENGRLREPGWSRSMLLQYERSAIRSQGFRVKEWDYYLVLAPEYAVALTISDADYIGLQSVSLLNFAQRWEHTETILNAFPFGRLNMPATSEEGVTRYKDKRLDMSFTAKKNSRRIICEFKDFYNGKDFACDITLDEPDMDSIVIATPWKDKKAFYYNQKINCMRASGAAVYDGHEYRFDPDKHYGTLDWGRGVWTYDNTWYWSSGNGTVNGKPFGFNIGYGFGDTSAASENIIFYDGLGHKLDDVTFDIPNSSYMKPWKITSTDSRFEMDFTPILDRAAKLNALLIVTDQHQVFGRMSGTAVLDDGTRLDIKNLMCFAEKVHNRY